MQQHPIPQNISSYSFRLIGNMTLKQFFELALGIGMGFLIYNLNLFAPIKLTLTISSVIFGFALAFMPIEERPLDHWIRAFIKAIYHPTHFVWKKKPLLPSFFTYTPHPTEHPTDTQEIMKAIIQRKRAGLSSFLQTLPPNHLLTTLEQQENSRVDNINQLFLGNTTSTLSQSNNSTTSALPLTQLNINYTPSPPTSSPTTKPTPKKTLKTSSITTTPTPATSIKKTPIEKRNQPAQNEVIFQSTPQPISTTTLKQKSRSTTTAKTSSKLPFPSTPTTKNTVVGMVLTTDNKIIENAIIEIRDSTQTPVRATKTNKLGQFFSTTPLKDGTYEIEVEKQGFHFDILKLELTGEILKPLKIQSKQ